MIATLNDVEDNIDSDTRKKLQRVKFMTVEKVLCHRSDLASFISTGNFRVTSDQPWFGEELKKVGREALPAAKPEYRYYCGFAGSDAHFCKRTRLHEQFFHMPADVSITHSPCPPQVGGLIMGEVENGPGDGRRLIWWVPVMVQDQRFARLILGQTSYTRDKIEKKLAIEYDGRVNTTLVRLAKEYLNIA